MIVTVQDTREQRPLEIKGYAVEVAGLPVGDYGVKGFSDWNNPAFICERKSVGDLVGSLTRGRRRFTREVEGLRRLRFASILIEGMREQVELGAVREFGDTAKHPGESRRHRGASGGACVLVRRRPRRGPSA